VSMKRINNIFKIKPGIINPKRPSPSKTFKGNISFSGVYFKHHLEKNTKSLIMENFKDFKDTSSASKDSWVLEDISFDIDAGMQVGIVGFTGSGKSTLVNLLPRLDDPQKGKIFLDGKNIRSYTLDHLRGSIGYVTQIPFLFSKTIKENILFGAEGTMDGLSEEEILNRVLVASNISHLHTDISGFPDSYDTLIGERGVTLSGGQKQRLAIARALVAQPQILILDDSFSNVDTDTEESILKDLKAETTDITTIIISHRISTIKDSDLIIVLDEGKIDSTGKHGELMTKCTIYKSLYKRQQLAEELDEEL